MAQTYMQIQRQIEALQKHAEKLKSNEIAGVVERIKTAIAHYDLTPEQLFGVSSVGARKATSSSSAKAAAKSSSAKGAPTAAYADGAGKTWGGRGPRPRWLREALVAGKSLEEFATGSTATKGSAPAAKKKVGGKRKAKQAYKDQAGNVWSGFGPKPKWLREALDAGKTLEDLASPAKN